MPYPIVACRFFSFGLFIHHSFIAWTPLKFVFNAANILNQSNMIWPISQGKSASIDHLSIIFRSNFERWCGFYANRGWSFSSSLLIELFIQDPLQTIQVFIVAIICLDHSSCACIPDPPLLLTRSLFWSYIIFWWYSPPPLSTHTSYHMLLPQPPIIFSVLNS